jgi:hypothetical protein
VAHGTLHKGIQGRRKWGRHHACLAKRGCVRHLGGLRGFLRWRLRR